MPLEVAALQFFLPSLVPGHPKLAAVIFPTEPWIPPKEREGRGGGVGEAVLTTGTNLLP